MSDKQQDDFFAMVKQTTGSGFDLQSFNQSGNVGAKLMGSQSMFGAALSLSQQIPKGVDKAKGTDGGMSRGKIQTSSSFLAPKAGDNIQWENPPKSMVSRADRREKARVASQQKRFIRQLRDAFDESDPKHRDKLTFDQWKKSELRNIIQEGRMSDEEYTRYFNRIDTDFDGWISWNELVQFLMTEIASVTLGKNNDTAQFIHKAATPLHQKSHVHRDTVTQIAVCNRRGEYVTLSSDSIRFWSRTDLTFRKAILEPGLFATMVILENSAMLAVATTSRRLIFFELDALTQLPAEISASPSPKRIRGMTRWAAQHALQTLDSPNMPLFNVPIVLGAAQPTHEPGVSGFFLGDDNGVIEAFEMSASLSRLGVDCTIDRIGRHQVHNSSVTQIKIFEDPGTYGSTSMDGTLKLWTFSAPPRRDVHRKEDANSEETDRKASRGWGSFSVLRVFTDEGPMLGFVYSDIQKMVVTCGTGREAFVWSAAPPRRMFRLGGHYNTLSAITDFETTSGERYLLTMTSRKEFRLWDALNYRMIREWCDPTVLRPNDRYSAAFFDFKRHALVTAANAPVIWCEDEAAMNESMEIRTHNRPIVGCCFSKEFDQIVTVDTTCMIKVWSVRNGRNTSVHQEPWSPESADIAAVTLDVSGRRMITSSFKNEVIMWNHNSGTIISNLHLSGAESLITQICFCHINGRDYLVRAGWDKTIALFTEYEKSKFRQYREFHGHTGDISAIVGFHAGVVSGSINGEIYSWSCDTNMPVAVVRLRSGVCVECFARGKGCLFIGDSNGRVHSAVMPKLTQMQSTGWDDLTVRNSISALLYDDVNDILYAADTNGYVRKWTVNYDNGPELIPGKIYRCHGDEISAFVAFQQGEFLATCGVDMVVRVWRASDFQYVGFFSTEHTWNIDDENTWVKKRPYKKDKEHFKGGAPKEACDESLSSTWNVIGSMRSTLRSQLSGRSGGDPLSSGTDGDEPEEEASLDFEAVGRVVNDYMNEYSTKRAPKSAISPVVMNELRAVKDDAQLQPSMRPTELIEKIQQLIDKPNSRSRSALAASNSKKTIRLPIAVSPSPWKRVKKKRQVPFLVQTTPWY